MKTDRKAQPKIERLRRVAYHEAGHVAVALRERISICEVTIIPGEGYLGLARNHHPPSFFRAAEYGDLSSRQVEPYALVCLAGAVAEIQTRRPSGRLVAGAHHEIGHSAVEFAVLGEGRVGPDRFPTAWEA